MTVNNKRTLRAKGTIVASSPHERAITFRITAADYGRIKGVAIKNFRTISQECAMRLQASLDAEEAQQ